MSVSKISNRYAKSLIDLGLERNTLEEIIVDAKAFLKMAEDREFYLFLKSPIIKAEQKEKVFDSLFGNTINEELMLFFKMVMKKGRENILTHIIQAVLDKYKKMKGISTVVLTSAVPLSDVEFDNISKKLSQSQLVEKNVEFIKKVKPEIIGGFIIEIGDKLYDASISAQLKKIRKQLIKN